MSLASWWFNQVITNGGAVTLSDIMFLAKKEFDGKLRKDQGILSTTGNLAILTANTDKDMYIARAKVTFYNNTNTSAIVNEVALKINNVIVESTDYSSVFTVPGGGVVALVYEFKNIGHKVAAGETIRLDVISLDAEVDVAGFIECWEENTGETPVI